MEELPASSRMNNHIVCLLSNKPNWENLGYVSAFLLRFMKKKISFDNNIIAINAI
jgi:hypothetical protein